jgi:FkbM family methyltransferase
MAIFGLVAMRALSPIWRVLDRIHVHLPSPLSLIRRYRIREGDNLWEVKGTEGAAYLFPGTALGLGFDGIAVSSGLCIDVGASFGWHTVRWARGFRHVLALEPDPRHYSSLVQNVALNCLDNVTTLRCAAGESDGVLELFIPEFGLSTFDASAVLHWGTKPPTLVPMRTIDSLCDELGLADVHLVKVDVEGYESHVLRGMSRVLQRDRPTVIFEAWTTGALEACRAELPGYGIRQLNEWDYLAQVE